MDQTNERPVIARLVRPVKPANETVEVAFEALTDSESLYVSSPDVLYGSMTIITGA